MEDPLDQVVVVLALKTAVALTARQQPLAPSSRQQHTTPALAPTQKNILNFIWRSMSPTHIRIRIHILPRLNNLPNNLNFYLSNFLLLLFLLLLMFYDLLYHSHDN